jgi:hypothetical protein
MKAAIWLWFLLALANQAFSIDENWPIRFMQEIICHYLAQVVSLVFCM